MSRAGVVAALGALLALPIAGIADPVAAQEADPRAERRLVLEGEVPYLTAGWALSPGGRWALLPELGIGFHEVKTFAPTGGDFMPVVHFGLRGMRRLGERSTLDVGLRAGLSDYLHGCDGDCLLKPYTAWVVGLAWDGSRFGIGTRAFLALQEGDGVLAWSPVFVRVRL